MSFALLVSANQIRMKCEEMRVVLKREFAKRDSSEWLALFLKHEIPAELVTDLATALRRARHDPNGPLFAAGPDAPPVASFSFQSAGPRLDTPAPRLGEHTDSILIELLKMDESEVESLRARGIVE